jgi:hypothetical protein
MKAGANKRGRGAPVNIQMRHRPMIWGIVLLWWAAALLGCGQEPPPDPVTPLKGELVTTKNGQKSSRVLFMHQGIIVLGDPEQGQGYSLVDVNQHRMWVVMPGEKCALVSEATQTGAEIHLSVAARGVDQRALLGEEQLAGVAVRSYRLEAGLPAPVRQWVSIKWGVPLRTEIMGEVLEIRGLAPWKPPQGFFAPPPSCPQ